MARRKKIEEEPVLTYAQRLSAMRNGRIDKEYLSELIMQYKFKRSVDSTFPMPRELAEVALIVIDKTLGGYRWRGYTEDWKEEMRGKAIEHVLKYVHNYDAVKSSQDSKNKDPYYYIGRIASNAFIQSWKKCDEYSSATIPLNDDILHSYDNSDEYNVTLKSIKWGSHPDED